MNFLAAVCVGGPPSLLPRAWWPLAVVWRAGARLPGVCGGLFSLDPRLASLALVSWFTVVRRAASCLVLPCCVMLVRAVLRCALVGRVVLRRVVLWCAALCPIASRRVMPWDALSWCIAQWRAAMRCAVLPRVVPWWVGGGQSGPCCGAGCESEGGWLVAGGRG